MAGKKKSSKKVAKKVSKKAPKKMQKKVMERLADAHEDLRQAEARAKWDETLKEIEENPYAYRVYTFLPQGMYHLHDFKTIEAAQECIEAQRQVNTRVWEIVMERRQEPGLRGAVVDAW